MSKKAIILFRVVAFLLIAHCLCVYDGRHSITPNLLICAKVVLFISLMCENLVQ